MSEGLQQQAVAIANHYMKPSRSRQELDEVIPARRAFLPVPFGRPRLLTFDIAIEVGNKILETGGYIEDACAECDIPHSTFYHWKKLGQRDREQGLETAATYLLDTVEKADAMVRNGISESAWTGDKKWLSRVTLGQRKYPRHFGINKDESNTVNVLVQIGAKDSDVRVLVQGGSDTASLPE